MNVQYAGFRAVKDAAAEVGLELTVQPPAGNGGIDLILTPLGADYRVKGRRSVVCVHGYEAFIEALLERKPNAVVKTQEATYRGLDDFDARQDDVIARLESKYGDQGCDCE